MSILTILFAFFAYSLLALSVLAIGVQVARSVREFRAGYQNPELSLSY
ncbi:hypothetical protein [Rothia nasimurium]